jgi:hypothetical protein
VSPSAPVGSTVTFRGLRNLDATLEYAFDHFGLGSATEMVVTGTSAGGLATFLHADRIANKMGRAVRTTAAPTVGYFLDHKHDPIPPPPSDAPPDTRTADVAYPRGTDYPDWIKYIYNMQAVEAAGGVSAPCLAAYPDSPHLCFMAPHLQQFVQTPFFMFNSKYDAWQLDNEAQLPCFASDRAPKTLTCDRTEQNYTLQYGSDFLNAFEPVRSEPRNGAFITSCICHSCPWFELTLANKTSYSHYADWHHGQGDRRGAPEWRRRALAEGLPPLPMRRRLCIRQR